MKRLTKRFEDGRAYLPIKAKKNIPDEQVKAKEKAIVRLAELEDELERGQAVELRCKVGDAIYQTDTNGAKIYCSTVQRIIIENSHVIYCTDSVDFDERAIGQSIFLTEEAAEDRAKELRGNTNT